MDEWDTHARLKRLLQALFDQLPGGHATPPVPGDGPLFIELEIDAQRAQLLCSTQLEPVFLTVACPLGPVPQHGAQAGLQQLLRMSHAVAGSGTTVGYEPMDEGLYLLHTLPLTQADAGSLIAVLFSLVAAARQWHETRFDAGDPAPPPALQSMGACGSRP